MVYPTLGNAVPCHENLVIFKTLSESILNAKGGGTVCQEDPNNKNCKAAKSIIVRGMGKCQSVIIDQLEAERAAQLTGNPFTLYLIHMRKMGAENTLNFGPLHADLLKKKRKVSEQRTALQQNQASMIPTGGARSATPPQFRKPSGQ